MFRIEKTLNGSVHEVTLPCNNRWTAGFLQRPSARRIDLALLRDRESTPAGRHALTPIPQKIAFLVPGRRAPLQKITPLAGGQSGALAQLLVTLGEAQHVGWRGWASICR
jgi:hypothetical protein